MFLSLQQFRPGYRATRRWLWCSLLAIFLGLFSAAAFSRGTVLFEDHFDDESSLQNWEPVTSCLGSVSITTQELVIDSGPFFFQICHLDNPYALALMRLDPQRSFDLSAKLLSSGGRIIFHAQDYRDDVGREYVDGQAYVLDVSESNVVLRRVSYPKFPSYGGDIVAEIDKPKSFPVTVSLTVNAGTIRVLVDGEEYFTHTDPKPLPPGRIGLESGRFDDVILKALPDLRCSPDSTVDGKDPICEGGLFDNKLWAYLGPDDERITQVDFYLDGRFHRSEFRQPIELDGGKASRLSTGPHEIKAKVRYKDGSRTSFVAGFEVGEHSLRCSPDPVLDGNDAACEGGTFDTPTWVYWWPETGIKAIDYSIDGIFHRTERLPPFELDGGAASAFSGSSVIRAAVHFKDGRQPLTVETHASAPAVGGPLLCSADAVLDGWEGTDFPCSWGLTPEPVQAYLWPEDGIRYVDFYLDGAFHRTERYAPFELDGGAMTDLPAGAHDITAIVHYADAEKPATAIRTPVFAP